MNYTKLSLITAILVLLVCDVKGDATVTERQAKFLRFNGIPDLGKLSIERVLSQWNRTHFDDTSRKPQTEQPKVAVEPPKNEDTTSDVYTLVQKFSSAFKKCIFAQRKRIIQDPMEGKNIIFKCFRVELIKELYGVISEKDSITLLNGYVELEKLGKPRKPHKKITKKTVKNDEEPSESDANVIEDLLTDNAKTFGNSSSVFSRYGQFLIQEISDNLDHEEEETRSLKDSVMDSDFLAVLGELSRKFALRLNLFPGVSAKMKRSQSTGVTFDLELDDLSPFGGDDDDDDDDKKKKKKNKLKGVKDSSEEDSDEEEEDDDDDDDDDDDLRKEDKAEEGEEEEEEEEEDDQPQGKGKDKGGKQKKEMKKKMKMIKKIIPYLLIPMMIQAVMLPLAFKILMFFAIKALLAGKIALLLVSIALIKNATFKSDEDEYVERVGQEHYGYGKGEEYGAWVNGRRSFDETTVAADNHPYRAYAPTEKQK